MSKVREETFRDACHAAQVAYQETLSATKHVDEKLGQVMTTMAFLVAATVVLANTGVLSAAFPITSSIALPLLAILFGSFLLLTGLAVMTVFPALGKAHTHATDPDAGIQDSLLYFQKISDQSLEEWRLRFLDPDEEKSEKLRNELLASYATEAHHIAKRVKEKYVLYYHALRLLTLAVFCFVCYSLLACLVLVNPEQFGVASRAAIDSQGVLFDVKGFATPLFLIVVFATGVYYSYASGRYRQLISQV